MTYDEIAEMVESVGLPCAYDHYAEGEAPDPPYILFLLPGSDNFFADGEVYEQGTEVSIELYTDRKEPPTERRVEKILREHDIPWNKSEVWIEEEKLYEVRYALSVDYDAEADDESQEMEE